MAEWYGIQSLSPKSMRPFMNMLFSQDSKQMPSFYVPEQLDHLVRTIDLPKSIFFNSSDSIIEKMSTFPFYSIFINNDVKLKEYKSFCNSNSSKYIEHIFNIRQKENYFEKALNIKFCPSCIQEKKEFYLDREHQIQGNFICFKHQERLKYIEYNKYSGKNLNTIWKRKYIDSQYYISEDDIFIKIRVDVARAIHQVFHTNIDVSNILIKSKIRKKLRNLRYLDKNHDYFLNIEKFWNDFSSYNMLMIDNRQLFRIMFCTSREVNPVAYITLILFLFGTIENFFDYKINADEIIEINYFKNSYSLLTKPKHGTRVLCDYDQILRIKHNNDYEAIGIEENGYVRVEHKKCGHTWPIFYNNLRDFKECPSCRRSKYDLECKSLIADDLEYRFIGRDPDKRKNILILHETCGREISMPFNSLKEGKRCFYCTITDKYKQKVYALVHEEYIVLKFEGTKKKASFLHNIPNCMQPFEYSPINFTKLRQCPSCGSKKNFIDNRTQKNKNG